MRALAGLGLAALAAGYAAPVAAAATELAEDRWALEEVLLPVFAHPQFDDVASGGKGDKPAAVPEPGGKQ
jgi:hypothetical protein